MLEVSGIDMFRGETQVLWDVSLEVHLGERVAILGSNGAGKSSLLAAITGTLPPRRGTVAFKGESLAGMKPYQITQLGVALVPEGRRVYRDMTVAENLEMGAYPRRGRAQLHQTMEHVLRIFPVLDKRKQQVAGTLSGGEQQMLAIGRALMSRPELLLIDELSLGLAPLITKEIYRALAGLVEETTILLVEQNVEQALRYSQRAYILESGRVTRNGPSAELMADDDIRRAYLGM
jgi:branched-chain amino acid transport system ATP-binding protein